MIDLHQHFEDVRRAARSANDNHFCTVTALAMIAEISYSRSANIFRLAGRKHGRGCNIYIIKKAFSTRGIDVTWDTKRGKVKTWRSAPRYLTDGRYLIVSRNHIAAVINGVVYDTDPDDLTRVTHIGRLVRRNANLVQLSGAQCNAIA